MKKNIFLFALEEFQRDELKTTRHAQEHNFYSILDAQTLVRPEKIFFRELLEKARQRRLRWGYYR